MHVFWIQPKRLRRLSGATLQLLQTDYPRYVLQDGAAELGIPTDPSQQLQGPASVRRLVYALHDPPAPLPGAPFHEPGGRLYFHTDSTCCGVWRYSQVPVHEERCWESTVSTTRD